MTTTNSMQQQPKSMNLGETSHEKSSIVINGKTVVQTPTFEFLLKQIALAHKKQVKALEEELAQLNKQNPVETRSVTTQTEGLCTCFTKDISSTKINTPLKDKSPSSSSENEATKDNVVFVQPRRLVKSPKFERRKLSLKRNSTAQAEKFRKPPLARLEEVKTQKEPNSTHETKRTEQPKILVPESIPLDFVGDCELSGDKSKDLVKEQCMVIPDSLEDDLTCLPVRDETDEHSGKDAQNSQENDKLPASKMESFPETKLTSKNTTKESVLEPEVIMLNDPQRHQNQLETQPIKACESDSPSLLIDAYCFPRPKLKESTKIAKTIDSKLSKHHSASKPSYQVPSGRSKSKDPKSLKFTTKYAIELEPPDPKLNVKMIQTKLTENPLLSTKSDAKSGSREASSVSTSKHALSNKTIHRSISSDASLDLDETYVDTALVMGKGCGKSMDFDETFFDGVNFEKPHNENLKEGSTKDGSNFSKQKSLAQNEQIHQGILQESNLDNKVELQYGKRLSLRNGSDEKTAKKQRTTEDSKMTGPSERKKIPSDEQGPKYIYEEGCIRKKEERKKLLAYDCLQCQQYYENLDLPEDEKCKRIQECSRHRSRNKPSTIPAHFWDLGFPDTQECIARGHMEPKQIIYVKRRHPEL